MLPNYFINILLHRSLKDYVDFIFFLIYAVMFPSKFILPTNGDLIRYVPAVSVFF